MLMTFNEIHVNMIMYGRICVNTDSEKFLNVQFDDSYKEKKTIDNAHYKTKSWFR